MEEKKLSFWKKLIISIKNFERYQEFGVEKLSKGIIYLLELVAIFTIVVTGMMTYKFTQTVKNSVTFFDQNIEELSFKEGTLDIKADEPIVIDQTEYFVGKIIIDTKVEAEDQIAKYEEEMKNSQNGILILKDKIMMKNEMVNAITKVSYQDLKDQYNIGDLNKQNILDFFTGNQVYGLYVAFFIMVFIYMFMIYISSILVDSIVLAALGYLVARMVGMKIRFSATFNMGIHALTLPILLNIIYIIVNTFTGFTIKYFQIMYTAISYIYMIAAILLIRSDLIKRHIELTKIEEEQERVREELRQKKEEEEKAREDAERRKKDKEKERKEDEEEKKEKKKVKPEIEPEAGNV